MATTLPCADGQRVAADLDALAQFTAGGAGCNRTLFSSAYNESRSWVAERMTDAGLEVRSDAAGNIIGTLEGEDPTTPALMLGSHTDTVRGGGHFDGVVGVLGAIETVRLVRESGQKPRHTIRVVDFLGEEANDHGVTCLGSRSMTGELTAADLDRSDAEGVTLGDQCARAGLNPSAMIGGSWPRRRDVSAYLELHIEQGPVLEQRGVEIGVVTAIAGIERLIARFLGQADHAGTMPMLDRRDALAAAAETVLAVRQLGCDAQGAGVATTSRVSALPGSPNVVPSAARLEAEMRSTDPVWLDTARRRLTQEVADSAAALGVEVELEWVHDNRAQPLNDSLQTAIVGAAESLGRSWAPIPSGATHDAVHVARRIPAARLEAEMRSTDPVWLDTARRRLTQEVADSAAALGVEVELDWVHDNRAQPLNDSLQTAIAGAAESLGRSWAPVPSGATHDAVHVARRIPAAMIFVPSVGGRSHCPEEMTKLSDITAGIDVLAQTVLALDRR